MTGAAPRIPPLPREEWTDASRAVLNYWRADGAADQADGGSTASNLLLTLANHPSLARAFLGLGDHLLFRSTLPDRVRELLTLRIAWLNRAEHEWAWHVLYAREIGFSDAELSAIKTGPDAPVWRALDRAVLEMVEQLRDRATVAEGTWHVLAAALDRRQLMDLVFTAGHYTMLSWASAAFGIVMEDDHDVPRDFALPGAATTRPPWRPGVPAAQAVG